MADYDIIELRKKDSGDVFYPLTHVDAVIGLTDQSFFMKDASGNVTLKPQYQNLWVPGWLAAGGVGTGGGGGGGATWLGDLQDVGITSPQPGNLLMYDPTQAKPWVNVPQSAITPDLSSWTGSSSITTVGTLSSGSVPLSLVTGADDIKAIEALSGTSGFLKKTAANTWSLDTTAYLSSHQTVTLATGTNSGTMKLTTAAGTTDNVAVKNCVTTDQTQTITGAKTFSATTTAANIVPSGSNNIGSSSSRWANIYGAYANLSGTLDLALASAINIGPVTITYDSTNKAVCISGTDSGQAIGLYCNGWITAGGVGGGGDTPTLTNELFEGTVIENNVTIP